MMSAVVPDVDGLGAPFEIATRSSAHPLLWWTDYHHVIAHNLIFAVMVALLGACLTRRWIVAVLCFIGVHLHLAADLIGSRGPDGYVWPIRYLEPFSDRAWSWSGQWALNGWPNFAITIALVGLTLLIASARGRTPLETVSDRANEAVVTVARKWLRRSRPRREPLTF